MKKMKTPSFAVAVTAITVFSLPAISCGNRGGAAAASTEGRPVERAVEGPPEPEHASYALDLGEASLLLVGKAHPDLPFPKSVVVGTTAVDSHAGFVPRSLLRSEATKGMEPDSKDAHRGTNPAYNPYLAEPTYPAAGCGVVDLVYGEDEVFFRAFGAKDGPIEEGAARFEFDEPREARRGSSVYRIEGRSLVHSAEESVSGGQASSASLRRWEGERLLVAGPAVFQDRILLATDAPSFVALDRTTLALVFERPMEALAAGPLVAIPDSRVLFACHADGSVGLYSLAENAGADDDRTAGRASAADPVAALIDPPPEALAAMGAKTATLMGRDHFRFPPVKIYVPRRVLAEDEVSLFRLDTEGEGGPMRLYLEGSRERPYLIASFNAAGEFIKSNIDYTGAEKVLELRFQPGATYFFAVAYLASAEDSPVDEAKAGAEQEKPFSRFVIVPKK